MARTLTASPADTETLSAFDAVNTPALYPGATTFPGEQVYPSPGRTETVLIEAADVTISGLYPGATTFPGASTFPGRGTNLSAVPA